MRVGGNRASVREELDPPGLDRQRVERWFASMLPELCLPLRFDLIEGGRSNLTYRVTDRDSHAWVLRRPPVGDLPPGAHSMVREWRIITALESTNVPVPAAIAFCDDLSVTGAEFSVMSLVSGDVIDSAERAAALTPEARLRLSDDLVEVLTELHRIDPIVVGAKNTQSREAYLSRQLRMWMAQIDQDSTAAREIRDVHELLVVKRPPERWTGLTHGDYRPGNVLTAADGTINAVLDWELWSVGDVLADLGWLAAWWTIDDTNGWSPQPGDGFRTTNELVEGYGRLSGHDTSDVDYYIAFALWRLACIGEGVYKRYARGEMGQGHVPLSTLERIPRDLVAAARSALP